MLLQQKQDEQEKGFARIVEYVPEKEQYTSYLPLYTIKAACGHFGDGEKVEKLGWIKAEGISKPNMNMYVVQASGHSMEPRIHDGDYCVFNRSGAGSRQGKIVLVQHHNYYDDDFGGSYSIKEYSSKKTYDELGEWEHERIELIPYNKDYKTIVLTPEYDDEEFRVIGEFVGVINN